MDVLAKLISIIANYGGSTEATSALMVILALIGLIILGTGIIVIFIGIRYLITGSTKPTVKEIDKRVPKVDEIQKATSQRFIDDLRGLVDNAVEKNFSDQAIFKMVKEAVDSKADANPDIVFYQNLKKPKNLRELVREFIEDALIIKGIENDNLFELKGDDQ